MFAAIKHFFAPSFAFSLGEIRQIVSDGRCLSYSVFKRFLRMFWWVLPVGLLYVISLIQSHKWNLVANPMGVALAEFSKNTIFTVATACFFIISVPVIYLFPFLLLRNHHNQHLGFRELFESSLERWPFMLAQLVFLFIAAAIIGPIFYILRIPLWIVSLMFSSSVYSLSFDSSSVNFGDEFSVFFFLKSENSFGSAFMCLIRGLVLNARLMPLRLALFLYVMIWTVPVLALIGLTGWLLFWLFQVAYWPTIIIGIPWVIGVLFVLLWAISRGVFLKLSIFSIVFDRLGERFLELFIDDVAPAIEPKEMSNFPLKSVDKTTANDTKTSEQDFMPKE